MRMMGSITTMTTITTAVNTTMTMMTTSQATRQEQGSWEMDRHSFRAMNTDVQLTMERTLLEVSKRTAMELFQYFEQLLSRFRPNSELSRLNACQQPAFAAGEDLFAAVEASLWAAQQTAGIYDPTILAYLEEAGYDRTFEAVDERRPLGEAAEVYLTAPMQAGEQVLSGTDYRHVGLDPFTHMIVRPAGLRIDLGGMGKGWTVDRTADVLCEKGAFLLNAGGDLYAYGTPGTERGWEVHLAHPKQPDLNFASLTVDHQAVATSTTARRRWLKDGGLRHHLIDPRTGCPAISDALSVSVVAGRVFTAEIYAKTALILGIEEGCAFLESLEDVEGAFYSAGGEVRLTSGMDRYLYRVDPCGYKEDKRTLSAERK
jgi:thiamine biosynthesis lipoprotein